MIGPGPDIEAIVGDYLRSDPAITALVGDRVGGEHPRNRDEPWITIHLVNDPVHNAKNLHLIDTHLQLDCYGSNDRATMQGEASLLSRTARGLLAAMEGTHGDAVITGVTFSGRQRIPDTDFSPQRQRYILDCTVTAHPAPESS